MKLDVLDIKGNKVASMDLKGSMYSFEPNDDVLRQYIRVYYANQRQGTSSTKDRGEVSGGGRKPWKQKHTGRARQGSIRSPIWVHGGVAFGPKPKSWRIDTNKKTKMIAFLSVLVDKLSKNKVIVLDDIKMNEPKTKSFVRILADLKIQDPKVLIVWNEKNENLIKSSMNIPGIHLAYAGNINAFDLLKADTIIFIKDALKVVEERYKNEIK